MLVADAMTRNPISIPARATVNDALMLMHGMEFRHLPVVNDEGRVVGMLSDRDLRQLPLPVFAGTPAKEALRTPLDVSVNAVMSRDVASVGIATPLREVVDLLVKEHIGAVPVVDSEQKLIGVVSYVDILKLAREAV